MNGILLIDKPQGWTSFDVVNYIRRIIAQYELKKPKHCKVGHTGTLDPLATGLMVIVVGSYCKRAQDFSKLDKTYAVMAFLGKNSSTGDAEGELVDISSYQPDETTVRQMVLSFVGESMQTPPAYSAIKINGKRAYELARAGELVSMPPRKVTIYSIDGIEYSYPEVSFTARVSSGTYIRSLVSDIGVKLGCGAYMSELRRVKVGQFDIDDASSPKDLTYQYLADRLITL